MTGSRLVVPIGLTALALLATGASAQSGASMSSKPPPKEASVRWAQAVTTHAAGEADEALVTIAGWSHARTLAVLKSAPAVVYDVPFLHRAVTLHTDIAIVERAAFDREIPPAFLGKVLVIDPTRKDAVARAFQWDVARLLAAKLAAAPDGVPVARLWYRATSAMLQQWGDCATLRPHVEAGLKLWPDDPVLLLVAGTLHQTYADVRVQRYIDGATDGEPVRRPLVMGGLDPVIVANLGANDRVSGGRGNRTNVAARVGAANTDTELDRAQQAFRRALTADAALTEARVRLAHTQIALARPADALTTLEPLRRPTLAPAVAYYEAMVRGSALEAVGQPREALAAFERAAALRPGAQSARIAISRQVLIDGHPIDALQSLVDAVGPRARRGDDPWYDYFRFHQPDARTMFADFRAMAR